MSILLLDNVQKIFLVPKNFRKGHWASSKNIYVTLVYNRLLKDLFNRALRTGN